MGSFSLRVKLGAGMVVAGVAAAILLFAEGLSQNSVLAFLMFVAFGSVALYLRRSDLADAQAKALAQEARDAPPSLIGASCIECGQRIAVERTAFSCRDCGAPAHKACRARHRANAHPKVAYR